MRRNHYYADVDGEHFPDVTVGDELFHVVSIGCLMPSEDTVVDKIQWVVNTTGITIIEEFAQPGEAVAKLRANTPGCHKVIIEVTYLEHQMQQTTRIPMILRAY